MDNCELASDEYDYLMTTITTGTLEKFHIRTGTINKEMVNSLAKLLNQTKSLQVVEWRYVMNSSSVLKHSMAALNAALKHTVVKDFILKQGFFEDSRKGIIKLWY